MTLGGSYGDPRNNRLRHVRLVMDEAGAAVPPSPGVEAGEKDRVAERMKYHAISGCIRDEWRYHFVKNDQEMKL